MTDQQAVMDAGPKRPVAITIICVIGFIGAALTVPMLFFPQVHAIGAWYPPMLGISAVIGLVCMIGLWMMRKWAVYTYTAFTAVNQVILLAMSVWNPFALIIPGIVIVIMFIYVGKMR